MHHFNEAVAAEYGVHAAVLLQNIYYWCEKNKANGRHLHDGYFWTYNSAEAFSKLFWYMTKWQIRGALKKLEEGGLIITGNYNQSTYDRTLWYAVTQKGEMLLSGEKPQDAFCENTTSILQKTKMEIGENQNGDSEKPTPIPYINTDKNITDIKTDSNGSTRTRTAKETYGEYKHVKLTRNEMDRLVNDYGSKEVSKAIKLLDEYIEEKGYKSKSHNLALRRWVFDAVKEREEKQGRKPAQTGYDWDNL